MFDKLAKTIIGHPKRIITAWIVVLLIAVPFMIQYNDVLNYDMNTMLGGDSESMEGLELIDEEFYSTADVDIIVLIEYDQENIDEIGGFVSVLQNELNERYGDDVVVISDIGKYNKNGDISISGADLIAIAFTDNSINATDEVGNIRDDVTAAKETSGAGFTTYVTGSSAITYDTMEGATKDMSIIDPVSILLIIILLGLFFWTITTAIVPPATVGMAYGIVLALIFAIGQVLDIFYVTSIIVLVSMLGAGCDYSIFIISRYREERKKGKDKNVALTESIKWAGESVATSGLAVIIGFGVMACCSFSLISSMGLILAIGIVVAMVAALTFIPAILALIGDKVFWPRTIESYSSKSPDHKGTYSKLANLSKRYFTSAAKFSRKHAKVIAVSAVLISVPMLYIMETTDSSYDMVSIMPDSEGKEGINTLIEYTDGGMLMPTYVVTELDSPIATLDHTSHTLIWSDQSAEYLQMTNTISADLKAGDDNIDYVLGPTPWSYIYSQVYQEVYAQVLEQMEAIYGQGNVPDGTVEQYIETNYGTAGINKLSVQQLPELIQGSVESVFTQITWDAAPDIAGPYIDYVVNYGGGTVSNDGTYLKLTVMIADSPMSNRSIDTIKYIDGKLPEYTETYSTYIVEEWLTGSVVATYEISTIVDSEFNMIELGVVILIFILLFFVLGSYFTPIRSLITILMSITWTVALTHIVFTTLLGIPVTWIIPIVLLVVCLGLGMDYDILITTRIKENKTKGMDNDEAIDCAIEAAGPIITLCGLIMGGTFLTLLVSSSPMLQEFGFALGFGILIDSLVMVTFVVPALMHLMGDWSWKGPKFLKRGA